MDRSNRNRRKAVLEARLKEFGQEQALRWWPELSDTQREAFLDQLERVDWNGLRDRLTLLQAGKVGDKFAGEMGPPEVVHLPRNGGERAAYDRARLRGEQLIAAGRIGVIVVAGGQGSRLGYDHPKGMFPLGPVTARSLFQIHAEKIIALGRRHGAVLPWAIMTSDATHEETVAFFQAQRFFGLGPDDVRFFKQEMIPAVDRAGKVLLAAKDSLFLNPDGHGGTLKALADEGILDWWEGRGVTDAYYFQVDNTALHVADPAFIGFHELHGSEMSSKGMAKAFPEERLGVFGLIDGVLHVIEYSDFDPDLAKKRGPDGELLYSMGSPAVHVLNLAFVRRMTGGGLKLPWHVAQKSIPCVNDAGEVVEPKEKNGLKFETFIFDAIPQARHPLVFEMSRAEEWAPLKNAKGDESIDTARAYLTARYAAWLEAAGVHVPHVGEVPAINIEISPLFALDAEDVKAKLDAAKVDVSKDIVIGAEGI